MNATEPEPVKYIAEGTGPITTDVKSGFIAVLLLSGLWDSMPPDERADWCNCGKIRNTTNGRLFLAWMRAKGFSI